MRYLSRFGWKNGQLCPDPFHMPIAIEQRFQVLVSSTWICGCSARGVDNDDFQFLRAGGFGDLGLFQRVFCQYDRDNSCKASFNPVLDPKPIDRRPMIPNYLVFRQALPVSRKADHGVANVVQVLAHSVYRAVVSHKGAGDLQEAKRETTSQEGS